LARSAWMKVWQCGDIAHLPVLLQITATAIERILT